MSSQPSPLPPSQESSSPKTPGLAIASLVLGIISVMGAAILIIPTILAIVFGHMSYSRIKKDSRLGGSGLALTGLILGYVSILFGIFSAGLLAAMAIPAFQKVRQESYHKMMRNDARQIANAAQQIMLAEGEKPIPFHIDPSTGEVTGPLSQYVARVGKGITEVDGLIDGANDSFSLQCAHVNQGQTVTFDANGREK